MSGNNKDVEYQQGMGRTEKGRKKTKHRDVHLMKGAEIL